LRKRFVGPSQGNAASWVQRGREPTIRIGLTRAPSLAFHSHLTPSLSSSSLRCDHCSDDSCLRSMDHHNLIRNIFSRNTSPPNSYASPPSSYANPSSLQSYPEEQSSSAQHFQQFQRVSPAQSLKDVVPSSPPAQVESLFSNLTAPGQSSGVNPNPPLHGSIQPTAVTTSGPTSPASSLTALSAPTNMSTSSNTPPISNLSGDSRQSALLSLISSVSPAGSSSGASGAPQQAPTPPGPPNRTGPITSVGSNAPASVNNESQGRLLLEQLMG